MWTQLVARVLSELPALILAAETNHPSKNSGNNKLGEVIEKQQKNEGQVGVDEGVLTGRERAIMALVQYANLIAAAERGLRAPRVTPMAPRDQQPPQVVTQPLDHVPSIPTPPVDTVPPREPEPAPDVRRQERESIAQVIGSSFTFPADVGQQAAFLEGRSTRDDFVHDMIVRNGNVVPASLDPELVPEYDRSKPVV